MGGVLLFPGWEVKVRDFVEDLVHRDGRGRFATQAGGGGSSSTAAKRPARPRQPKVSHRVSADTIARIDGYRARLPKDAAGWRGEVGTYRPAQRQVDRRVDELTAELAAARAKLAEADAALNLEFRRKRTPLYKRDDIRKQQLRDEARDVIFAENGLEYMREMAADPDLEVNNPALARVSAAVTDPKYPKDPNGVVMPPPSYEAHLDNVLAAGAELRSEYTAALWKDRLYRKLSDRMTGEFAAGTDIDSMTYDERAAFRDGRRDVALQLRAREQEILLRLLDQVRPMGGVRHTAAVAGTRDDVKRRNGGKEPANEDARTQAARTDWRSRLRDSERFFPADWLRRSADKPLVMVSSRRAYHLDLKENGSMLAMSTRDRDGAAYDGGFRDETAEVTVHEMGHRMETLVPGLKELEFTYVRRRATKGGVVERPAKLQDLYGGGYQDYEIALRDEWTNAYAGKTYEATYGSGRLLDSDPAANAWEVFQVGLQDLYGRSSRTFGGLELQHFMLGILATLARED